MPCEKTWLLVICAGRPARPCDRYMGWKEGDGSWGVSHGMCDDCLAIMNEELDALEERFRREQNERNTDAHSRVR